MEKMFESLDQLVSSFMSTVFDSINNFWNELFAKGGNGAYITFLLLGFFVAVIFLIGLFNMFKKFGAFMIFTIIVLVLPCLWFFIVK